MLDVVCNSTMTFSPEDKFIITISNSTDELEDETKQEHEKNIMEINMYVNTKLSDILTAYKNMISFYYGNKSWDRYKKLSNEYEFVYSSPSCDLNVSTYNPISRSFFKMWEILNDFKDVFTKQSSMKCVFLAEGPGGFAEAVMKFRNNSKDEYHGMTLRCENNKTIPDWKHKDSTMHITYGVDGTGNLYNVDNIKFLSKLTGGKNSVDLITADGGFDFSSDFNNQEEMCFKLVLCEILSALYLQKIGGTFILKIFDIFNDKTFRLVQILHKCYRYVHIIKPFTSRPANSEKYLVCTEFMDQSQSSLEKLRHILETCLSRTSSPLDYLKANVDLENEMVQKIIRFNTYAVMRQVFYIQKTIQLIRDSNVNPNAIIDKNKKICHEWCVNYKV